VKLSRQEVEHVALLARLELSDEEKERLTGRLNQIMEHFEMLQELDTSQVEPTSHSVPLQNVFRADVAGPSMPVEDVLANGPETRDDQFVVPQVVEI
jgi:aspartyl-tRNA(Asn)/glutamyl-tRNA(Gln) amidotransferase subunit C